MSWIVATILGGPSTFTPVSSRISRANAAGTLSPGSSIPPGRAQNVSSMPGYRLSTKRTPASGELVDAECRACGWEKLGVARQPQDWWTAPPELL